MPGPTMTAAELADELGRETAWIYRHWRTEAARRIIPHPLHGGAAPLTWSRAHVYAFLDRELTAGQRAIAAAFRAAAAAAAGETLQSSDEYRDHEYRQTLDALYAPTAR